MAALVQQFPNVPWLHYAYGIALASAGQMQEALEQEQQEAAISPSEALPWIEISHIELRLNHPQEALNGARRALAMDGSSSGAHDALAEALKADGKADEAAAETREAARLSSTSPPADPRMAALYRLHSRAAAAQPEVSASWSAGMRDYTAGRYADAVTELKSWVERNPNDGTAWAVMGLAEFAGKDYDNARIHLERGITLGLKGSAQAVEIARDRLALLLIRQGQFDQATAVLRPVAGQAPMVQEIQLALGLALLHMPTLPDDLRQPQRDLAQSAGAIIEMLFASRYSEAFPAFQKLIAEHPTTPWLHYAFGDALDSLSQYDDAEAQMRAELKLNPHNALPWVRLTAIDLQRHQPADAVKAGQNAVALAPESPQAHYEWGRALLESGETGKSIAELEKADGLKANSPEIHFALARAYAKANLPEKATVERSTFLQLKSMAAQNSDKAQGQSILKTEPQ
jgi:tetratricopeptide (TPR) repeat protein